MTNSTRSAMHMKFTVSKFSAEQLPVCLFANGSTLYPTVLALATACISILQPSAAALSTEDPALTAAAPVTVDSPQPLTEPASLTSAHEFDSADGAASFPRPTLLFPDTQIEPAAQLAPLTWSPAQPQSTHPEAIAPLDLAPALQPSDQPNDAATVNSSETFPRPEQPFAQEEPAITLPTAAPDPKAGVLSAQVEPVELNEPTEPVEGVEPSEPVEPSEFAESERFGTAGQQYWYVQGGSAISLDPDDDGFAGMGLAGIGITDFFANGHSISGELNGLGFLQPGDDALGLNLSLLLRWHFLRREDWSLYVDGGAGMMATTSNVPADGSQFNFTPQVGGGATIRLQNQEQLMIGLRWHHISNGTLFESNPGRDSVLLYVGLSRPR